MAEYVALRVYGGEYSLHGRALAECVALEACGGDTTEFTAIGVWWKFLVSWKRGSRGQD